MATKPDMHVNDYGTVIQMEIINRQTKQPLDLGSVQNMYMIFEPPSGVAVEKTAAIANPPGTDGVIQYTIANGDITEIGKYKVQGRVEDPTTPGLWHTDVIEFQVASNIAVP